MSFGIACDHLAGKSSYPIQLLEMLLELVQSVLAGIGPIDFSVDCKAKGEINRVKGPRVNRGHREEGHRMLKLLYMLRMLPMFRRHEDFPHCEVNLNRRAQASRFDSQVTVLRSPDSAMFVPDYAKTRLPVVVQKSATAEYGAETFSWISPTSNSTGQADPVKSLLDRFRENHRPEHGFLPGRRGRHLLRTNILCLPAPSPRNTA